MEILIEFGKLLIPALLVLYAMYLTVKNILEKTLSDWMGDQAQIDDILVVGVRT